MKDKNKFLARYASEIAGYILGFQILITALDQLEKFEVYPFKIGFLLAASICIIIGTLSIKKLKPFIKDIDAIFNIIEGAVSVVSAILLFEEGKVKIPFFIFFIGLFLIVFGIIRLKLKEENLHTLGRVFFRRAGFAFFIFGFAAIIFNTLADKDKWVYFSSLLFFAIGIFYTFFTDYLISKMKDLISHDKIN